MIGQPSSYRKALKDDESLAHFLAALADFDRAFCDAMASGADFTLKLEIHGNRCELLHARVQNDVFRRPAGVEKRVEKKAADTKNVGDLL